MPRGIKGSGKAALASSDGKRARRKPIKRRGPSAVRVDIRNLDESYLSISKRLSYMEARYVANTDMPTITARLDELARQSEAANGAYHRLFEHTKVTDSKLDALLSGYKTFDERLTALEQRKVVPDSVVTALHARVDGIDNYCQDGNRFECLETDINTLVERLNGDEFARSPRKAGWLGERAEGERARTARGYTRGDSFKIDGGAITLQNEDELNRLFMSSLVAVMSQLSATNMADSIISTLKRNNMLVYRQND